MKKHLLLYTLILPAFMAQGKALSPEEALRRTESDHSFHRVGAPHIINPVPLMTVKASDGMNSLYVFGNDAGGFMVVSADDCATPLLGYADSGSFDKNNLPPQMRGWLNFYAAQIAWAAKNGVSLNEAKASQNEDYPSIEPMLKCKWDQGAPYNDDCPLDDGKRSVTGCVATAMAQAMYHHQWPKTGTGSHSYSWNGETLSVDFANTTYDWDAMTPTYDDKSTDAAKAAVANLMYSCGVSVDMHYTSDESGASSMTMVSALYKYFGYDQSMTFPQRSYYGDAEWEKMVYDQLSQGLPVLYCGQSGEGGHQFICDGYDGGGYFHFNWGWSGMSDGYFLLSALNPLEQGIGGSESDSGFNYDQGIVLNMKPAQSDSQTSPLIYCYGNFGVKDKDTFALGDRVAFNGDFFNFACAEIKGSLGVCLTDEDGNTSYLTNDMVYGFDAFTGYGSYEIKLPEDLADGVYTVTPVFKPENMTGWLPVLCPLSGTQALTLNVVDGEATFSEDITNKVEVTDFTLKSPIYLGQNFEVTFTLTNTGTTEYFGEYLLFLLDSDGTKVAPSNDISTVDLLPGESTEITYVSEFPKTIKTDDGETTVQPGDYQLGLYTHFTHREIYVDPNTVTVSDAPATTTLKVESLKIDNGARVISTDDVTFTGTVECTEGYYAGRLKIAIFKKGETSTGKFATTDYVFIGKGESADFEAHTSLTGEESEAYFAIVFKGDEAISGEYPFKINTTGVGTAESESIGIAVTSEGIRVTSGYPITDVTIYSVDGSEVFTRHGDNGSEVWIPLQNYPKGEYVVRAADAEGHTLVRTVLR